MRFQILSITTAILLLNCKIPAAEYVPNSGWMKVTFTNPSLANDYLNDQDPFTFYVDACQQPIIQIRDPLQKVAAYRPVLNGQIFSPSSPMGGTGSWSLGAGYYSLKIQLGSWCGGGQSCAITPVPGEFFVEVLAVTPSNLSGCLGGNAVFRVESPSREIQSCQWYFNGTNLLAGHTETRLVLTNLTSADAGLYSARVKTSSGETVLPPATLQVFEACVGIQAYPGLSVTGIVGRTYLMESATSASATNWVAIATNTLTKPDWLFIDSISPLNAKKYYRVRLVP